ncbi:MAG TPA: arsenic resistance N-acetyltransferase ArsN2 [Gemmatimonadaceae bacterium]
MITDNLEIRSARTDDFPAVCALLIDNSLPLDGIPGSLAGFIVAEQDNRIVGVGGVEVCGAYGLLRSVAVDVSSRNAGVGGKIVERLIDEAHKNDVHSLFLLTTTAENYFPSHGFVRTERDSVPDPVRATKEFTEACPSSATVMRRDLIRD